jgi:hypothetical protein
LRTLTGLRKLSLQSTYVASLDVLRELPHLEWLDISYTRVNDFWWVNPALRRLDIRGLNLDAFDQAKLEQLRKDRPDLEIIGP